MAEKPEVVENEFGVDVAVRTIRGRACPICGGKIIPSNRAVYLSAGDPSDVFPLWECERCGFSEKYEKPEEPKKAHSAPAKALGGGEKPASGLAARTSSSTSVKSTPVATTRPIHAPTKREVPPDVEKMLEVMNRTRPEG